MIFLFYINCYLYAAQYQFFHMIFALSISICAAFLEWFEVPAIQEWNPFDRDTPRYNSPRIGYQHVLSDSNFGLGFDLWQSFIPLRGRDQFSLYEQGVFNELSEHPTLGINYNPWRPRANNNNRVENAAAGGAPI